MQDDSEALLLLQGMGRSHARFGADKNQAIKHAVSQQPHGAKRQERHVFPMCGVVEQALDQQRETKTQRGEDPCGRATSGHCFGQDAEEEQAGDGDERETIQECSRFPSQPPEFEQERPGQQCENGGKEEHAASLLGERRHECLIGNDG